MNYKIKFLKLCLLLGIFIAGSLLFSSCSNSKYGIKTKEIKNWVSWKVQFNPNTTDEEIAMVKEKINKFIDDYINHFDPKHEIILKITTEQRIDFRDRKNGPLFIFNVTVGEASMGGLRGPVPPSPPPALPRFARYQ